MASALHKNQSLLSEKKENECELADKTREIRENITRSSEILEHFFLFISSKGHQAASFLSSVTVTL